MRVLFHANEFGVRRLVAAFSHRDLSRWVWRQVAKRKSGGKSRTPNRPRTRSPRFQSRFHRRAFPFFVLYGVADDRLVFGSVIPSRSDPLTWLVRFK